MVDCPLVSFTCFALVPIASLVAVSYPGYNNQVPGGNVAMVADWPGFAPADTHSMGTVPPV